VLLERSDGLLRLPLPFRAVLPLLDVTRGTLPGRYPQSCKRANADATRRAAAGTNFDAARFAASCDTIYITAPAHIKEVSNDN
jgi:hypothetical protein